ncbi:MAG: molybdopterin-synthase adenylyltransferase MoeB [Deltaproteobacteria bacterium]|jgi:adenylyltransferase/sulfurtransferase|nr:molybdopterin-synthase adenylyltransferase MoeB [Deltaproteobacteria bacterium]
MTIISSNIRRDLSSDEVTRFSRQLLLEEIGVAGQERLRAARVLIVGVGGLGAPAAIYLAAAGVGTLGLVDADEVEASNLQRQIIYGYKDIDRPKVASAADRLKDLSPDIKVDTWNLRLDSRNAKKIIEGYDVVVDGTDNFPTRYLISDACVLLGKPNVYASILRFEGQVSVFDARNGPCYRCLYPAPPPPGLVPSCGEGGVMGVLPGVLGCIQANEAIKLIVGGAPGLTGRLLLFDAWNMTFNEVALEKDLDCPICGRNPTVTELIDYEDFCGLSEPETKIQSLSPTELKEKLAGGGPLQIIDIREPHERSLFKFEGTKPIPFGQLVRRIEEFDPKTDLVFICKIGLRSAFAIRTLQRAGYQGPMYNLDGGVNAWTRRFNPAMVIY